MSLILKEIIDECLVLSINRPEKRNALTDEMYAELAQAIRSHEKDPAIKVLLLKGAGGHFTSGNDLGKFAEASDESDLASTLRFMEALADFPMPVVAQVKGMAVGIGTTLLLHCDFAFCDQTTRFSLPFINLALVPEYASSLILPNLVGHKKAAEWLMLGEPFGPEEAQQFGLINKVVTTEQLQPYCEGIIKKLCQRPKDAMRYTKELMKSNTNAVKSHISTEIEVFMERLNSVAAKEAFNAFLEKRKPDPEKYK